MPAITEPAERALVGPLDGAAHRLLNAGPHSRDRWRRRLRNDCPGLGPGSPSALLRPAGKLRPFFLHERPEFINFHLAQMQIAGQYLRQRFCMGRRPLEPHADRLVFMPSDLFCCPQAAASHHDQQRLRHLRMQAFSAHTSASLACPQSRSCNSGSDSVASLGDSHCVQRGTLDSRDLDTRAGCTLPFSLARSYFTSYPLIVSPPHRVTTE